jgi:ATP-dependent DNA helicase RecG
VRTRIADALPFKLTAAQTGALTEIVDDMEKPERMVRLLQGDVGSGKTVVALLAMAVAIEAGAQAALMAPTEILARQHLETLAPLCEAARVRIDILTGRDKGAAREEKLARLAHGAIDILVGTHALFQEGVDFRDLAFVVIDEQHRFGVHQRVALSEKGPRPDVLVMTATPIPRTLALTTYGDMEASAIREKPPGRKPVATRTIPLERLDEVVAAVKRAADKGEQIYWVCPLVEESELVAATAAEDRYIEMRKVFGDKVGLVHGRLSGPEKDAVMDKFHDGEIAILIATTVIEVGVNAPNATVMVIEHAERFGLAQLHQLRGRVGRSDKPSACLLLYKAPLGETATARLKILRDTEDGFRIAEEDLRLRGAGDVLGAAQSGFPQFRLADLAIHGDLLAASRDDARLIVEKDADLKTERGEALRALLYLFSRDDAVRLIRSG